MACHLSVHNPILFKFTSTLATSPRPFRFQSMWSDHKDFFRVVNQAWGITVF